MVPLGAVLTVRPSFGPDQVLHYNAYPAADINGGPAPGYSSGQAQEAIEGILREVLPNGIGYEWTDLTYQEKLAGNTAVFIFPLCVVLVLLVLAVAPPAAVVDVAAAPPVGQPAGSVSVTPVTPVVVSAEPPRSVIVSAQWISRVSFVSAVRACCCVWKRLF
jgi:hypothetical protein